MDHGSQRERCYIYYHSLSGDIRYTLAAMFSFLFLCQGTITQSIVCVFDRRMAFCARASSVCARKAACQCVSDVVLLHSLL